ncbi:ATP-binding protein [Vreelandella venusta]|uniref:ATP-binding protein n=1 Tax=Vreelandella venusta TaxID=44935 RepID=UPI00384F96F9
MRPLVKLSLRARLLGSAGLWSAIALVGVGLFIYWLFKDHAERTFDARLDANLLGLMASVEFNEQGQLIKTRDIGGPQFDRAYSGWYWQIAHDDEVLIASRSLLNASLPALTSDVSQALALTGPEGEALRARGRHFSAPGSGPPLSITVAGPQSEIDDALSRIVLPLVASLALLGGGLAVAVWWQVRWGLKPLTRLRRDLLAVRQGQSDQLAHATVEELQPLVDEINALVTHNREVIARSRQHVGNLAHGLKTPLAMLANSLSAQQTHDATTEEALLRLQRLVDHHLRRARAVGAGYHMGERTQVADTLEGLVSVMRHVYARGPAPLHISVQCDDALAFRGESQDLDELLGNLLDNACKWARQEVMIEARRVSPEQLTVVISDDGPGMPEAQRLKAVERGERFDESTPGDGLGLAIVQDLARLYGGHLALAANSPSGLRVELTLPAAERPPKGDLSGTS